MVFGCCCSSSTIDPTFEPIGGPEKGDGSFHHSLSLVETTSNPRNTGVVPQPKTGSGPKESPSLTYLSIPGGAKNADILKNPPLTYLSTTSGDALSAGSPPFRDAVAAHVSTTTTASSQMRKYRDNVVAVMVPQGMFGGQTIRVAYPDGSGRQVEAQIPLGMTAGSVFHVKVDLSPSVVSPDWHSTAAKNQSLNDNVATKNNNTETSSSVASPYRPRNPSPTEHPYNRSLAAKPISSTDDTKPLFSHYLEARTPTTAAAATTTDKNHKLLKVTVPHDAVAGSTVHVKIPGEDRYVAAQVPPNCREFHVQYEPRRETTVPTLPPPKTPPTSLPLSMRENSPLKHFATTTTTQASTRVGVPFPEQRDDSSANNNRNAKLLLVQAPRGVQAGTTLHVQVPGEPGRVVSAQVPPGNVTQFHVSYVPRV